MENLDRFIVAQEFIWSTVQHELTLGLKKTHWMWFIFPQLTELGLSDRAKFYGLKRDEALAYSRHPVLGERLREACNILMKQTKLALEIFGEVDTEKLRSCLTLFWVVDPSQMIYKECLNKFFELPDERTLDLLTL